MARFQIITAVILFVGAGQINAQVDEVLENLSQFQAYVIEDSDNNTLTKKCISQPTDIVFLLDSSSSEGQNHFKDQVRFVHNITKLLEIGPDKVQISVVTFSEVPHNEFFLNEHTDKDELLTAIDSILYKPGNTQTDDGLDFAFHVSFLPEHGGRNSSDKIIIVLTDGESTDTGSTKNVADAIHSTDIRIISIGIGVLVNREELAAIATNSKNLYYVADFSALSSIVVDVTRKTCHSHMEKLVLMKGYKFQPRSLPVFGSLKYGCYFYKRKCTVIS